MRPRVGTTLVSTTDPTTVVVVRWGPDDVDLRCGGAPMVDSKSAGAGAPENPADPAWQAGTTLGKRYADGSGVELLCTKAGTGTLTVDGTPLPVKGVEPLPASD